MTTPSQTRRHELFLVGRHSARSSTIPLRDVSLRPVTVIKKLLAFWSNVTVAAKVIRVEFEVEHVEVLRHTLFSH